MNVTNYIGLSNGILSAYKKKTQKHMELSNPKKVAMYIAIFYSINSVDEGPSKKAIKDSVRQKFGEEIEYLKNNNYSISLFKDCNDKLQIQFKTPEGRYYYSTYPQCDIEW